MTKNVVHIAPSLSRLGGGVAPAVWELARHSTDHGVKSVVVGLRDEHTEEDTLLNSGVDFFAGRVMWPGKFGYSRELHRYLVEHGSKYNLVHSHGMWKNSGNEARWLSKRIGMPWIMSPHGMLRPWCLELSKMRKRIAMRLYESRNLRRADCLHATAVDEARNLREFGLRNPIGVIGIGLDVSKYVVGSAGDNVEREWPELRGKKRLLFLSRIHPVKGLMNLAEVWGELHGRFPEWHLVIAGPDEKGHRDEVGAAIERVGASGSTTFTGPVYSPLKEELFSASDVFVLPTFSENFGIVVPESLASGVPVITTNATPWGELDGEGCGWCIDVGIDALGEAMVKAMELGDEERSLMGQRGRELVERKYTWSVIGRQMAEVYGWLLGEEGKPGHVYFEDDEIA